MTLLSSLSSLSFALLLFALPFLFLFCFFLFFFTLCFIDTTITLFPKRIFRKMPLNFLRGSLLFLGYIDDQNLFQVCTLQLETGVMTSFATLNTPTAAHDMAFDGCALEDTVFLVTSPVTMYTLNLLTKEWTTVPLQGSGPSILSGSSNFWGGCLYVFTNTRDLVYELNLSTSTWRERNSTGSPSITLRDAHLMRPFDGDKFVLLRMSDNSELWLFNLPTFAWERRDTLGLRPGDYATNPSYVIMDNTVFCIGGQSSRKHILPTMPIAMHAQQQQQQIHRAPPPAQAAPVPVPAAPPANPGPVVQGSNEVPPPLGHQAPHHGGAVLRPAGTVVKNPDRKNELFMLHLTPREPKTTREAKLETRVRSFYKDPFCDVSFLFDGGRRVEGHRSILSTNPALAELFLKDLSVREFHLKGDGTAFEAFVEHLYERLDLKTTVANLDELFLLAEAYREPSLKKKIIDFKSDSPLSVSELLNTYKTASSLEDSPYNTLLKRKAETSISGDLEKVAKTKEFTQFVADNSHLTPHLLHSLAEQKSKTS